MGACLGATTRLRVGPRESSPLECAEGKGRRRKDFMVEERLVPGQEAGMVAFVRG